MTEEEKMIQAIKEYAYNYLDSLSSTWPEAEFKRVAYSRWAVDEILILVYSHMDWSPLRAVEEFRLMAREYSMMPTHYKDMSDIFDIAYDVAMDLSDILNAMI